MLKNSVQIDLNRIPKHVAIIMDGNGRWAQKREQPRAFGHQHGIKSIREVMEACQELKISYLTLYAFSKENWNRPQDEVTGLWRLLAQALEDEIDALHNNNVRFNMIGDRLQLDPFVQQSLQNCMEKTKNNTSFTLTLALNYGGRQEIACAARTIAEKAVAGLLKLEEITVETFEQYLSTADMPDPELIIRTSGEQRISNFLLWQSAYAEFYFTPILWPDFDKQAFLAAIENFQNRERRFGAISEQSSKNNGTR